MNQRYRSRLAWGIILILIGLWFLLVEVLPGLNFFLNQEFVWPFWVIGAGLILLIIGLLTGAPGMAVPASIVAGIGGILYWQNLTNQWATWSYAWALIPGFVGVGVVLAGLLGDRSPRPYERGLGLILTSLVLFVIFASVFGGLSWAGPYWPVLLIAVGLLLLVRVFIRRV